MNNPRYVVWHAPKAHHLSFDDAGDFNHELYSLGMEIPDQLGKVLSRGFKPRKYLKSPQPRTEYSVSWP